MNSLLRCISWRKVIFVLSAPSLRQVSWCALNVCADIHERGVKFCITFHDAELIYALGCMAGEDTVRHRS
jgi:hypothetical protein